MLLRALITLHLSLSDVKASMTMKRNDVMKMTNSANGVGEKCNHFAACLPRGGYHTRDIAPRRLEKKKKIGDSRHGA